MKILKGEKNHLSQVHSLIVELAIFEKEPLAVTNTAVQMEQDYDNGLFDFIVSINDAKKVIGFALYYWRYSTWKGKSFYLEDFYVQEKYRSKGIGKELFEECLEIAKKENCNQMNWQVLDWNKRAISFYKSLKAEISTEWYNGTISLS